VINKNPIPASERIKEFETLRYRHKFTGQVRVFILLDHKASFQQGDKTFCRPYYKALKWLRNAEEIK
jgi:hypothetical protein